MGKRLRRESSISSCVSPPSTSLSPHSTFSWYEDDVPTEIAKYLNGKPWVILGGKRKWFHRTTMEESIRKFACLRDLQVPDPGHVAFKWINPDASAFDGSHSYMFHHLEKHIDWMRIEVFFFDSSVALLTDRLIALIKAPLEQYMENKLSSSVLNNIKTGIWLAGSGTKFDSTCPEIFIETSTFWDQLLSNTPNVIDLQLVRCPVCDLNTCDGTMQTLDARHIELFLSEGYEDGSWAYKMIGSHDIKKHTGEASSGNFDIKHLKDHTTSDGMLIGAFFFDSPVKLLTEKLIAPTKAPLEEYMEKKWCYCGPTVLNNNKTGIWIADLQLVRYPVCELNTCDGTMQTLEARHIVLLLSEGYKDGSREYKTMGSYDIKKHTKGNSGGVFIIKHLKDHSTSDWRRIGMFFFDSSVALLTEKLIAPLKAPLEQNMENMLSSCVLNNIKTGIWLADLQLVRCPVCDLKTCDDWMQIEVFFSDSPVTLMTEILIQMCNEKASDSWWLDTWWLDILNQPPNEDAEDGGGGDDSGGSDSDSGDDSGDDSDSEENDGDESEEEEEDEGEEEEEDEGEEEEEDEDEEEEEDEDEEEEEDESEEDENLEPKGIIEQAAIRIVIALTNVSLYEASLINNPLTVHIIAESQLDSANFFQRARNEGNKFIPNWMQNARVGLNTVMEQITTYQGTIEDFKEPDIEEFDPPRLHSYMNAKTIWERDQLCVLCNTKATVQISPCNHFLFCGVCLEQHRPTLDELEEMRCIFCGSLVEGFMS